MYPVLFQIGSFKLHTYGVLVATAFLAGIALALREAHRTGEDANRILDLCFYMLIAAILGSRVMYVLVNWPSFRNDLLEVFRIWRGGLVFYGGFIAAVMTGLWYVWKHGLPLQKTADMLAPSIALGHAVGRIGCFFAGCCYGRTCDLPWAVVFTHPESLAPKGVPLHPTQLYSSLNSLIIFLVLLWLKRVKKFEGQVFWTYVGLYGLTRFVLEHFRGDDRGVVIHGMFTTSQLISIVMVATAAATMIVLRRRRV